MVFMIASMHGFHDSKEFKWIRMARNTEINKIDHPFLTWSKSWAKS